MEVLFALLLALLLDRCLGEPKRWHPLVGFGNWAAKLDVQLNAAPAPAPGAARLSGIIAWFVAVLPVTLVGVLVQWVLAGNSLLNVTVSGVVLYLAIGWQSLIQHARAVAEPLAHGQLDEARYAVSMIVSRDTEQLSEEDVAKAATESVLENGADAIFSALFWFLLAGIPGVVLYRLSNTLDAMWGYKTDRYLHFGWCAARMDDLLNFIPARLTALSYALAGKTRMALNCWRQQAFNWKSPNAGPVMAAGAGALNISLGGAAVYHQGVQQRPLLGPEISAGGEAPSGLSIVAACQLVNRALLLWCVIIAVACLWF